MADTIRMTVHQGGYAPIPSAVPDFSGSATFPAATATLLDAGGDGVLVDAMTTIAQGEAIVQWLRDVPDVRLSRIYVTHAHADHFFGASTVLDRIPGVELIAHPQVADAALGQVSDDGIALWSSFFPGGIHPRPRTPTAMDGDELRVGDATVRTIDVGQSDVPWSTVVHVPDLDAVVSGDVVYNGIHPWLPGSTSATRAGWLLALDRIEALQPKLIIAGHRDPDAPDDDAGRQLDFTRGYIRDFDRIAADADDRAGIIRAMTERYPDLGNPYTLALAAQGEPDRRAS